METVCVVAPSFCLGKAGSVSVKDEHTCRFSDFIQANNKRKPEIHSRLSGSPNGPLQTTTGELIITNKRLALLTASPEEWQTQINLHAVFTHFLYSVTCCFELIREELCDSGEINIPLPGSASCLTQKSINPLSIPLILLWGDGDADNPSCHWVRRGTTSQSFSHSQGWCKQTNNL